MKPTFLLIAFVLLIGLTTPAIAKNGGVGIYAIVDRVTFEPETRSPDRVRIDGIFVVPVPRSSGAYVEIPLRGYLYFRIRDRMEEAVRKDWAELQAVAGTGRVVAFADYWVPNPNDPFGNPHHSLEVRVHEDGESATPDVYPLPNRKGILKTADKDVPEFDEIAARLRPQPPIQAQFVKAQSTTPQLPTRTDSITVTEDYPKEQMRNEDECDAKIKLGEAAVKQSAFDKAQEYFQDAWSMTEKYKYLESRQERLLGDIGTTYLLQNRTSEAATTFKNLLDRKRDHCKPDSEYPADCAKAQFSLATATAVSGDLPAALTLINLAIDNYQRQLTLDDFNIEKYVHQTRQSEAMAYQAVLIARSGDLAKARSIITDARSLVERVIAAADSEPGALELARNSLALITNVAKQLQ